jgi:hypothetical protein
MSRNSGGKPAALGLFSEKKRNTRTICEISYSERSRRARCLEPLSSIPRPHM